MADRVLARNDNTTNGAYLVPVAAGAAKTCASVSPSSYGASSARCAAGVELLAQGDVTFKNGFGQSVTVTARPAGYKPCEISEIVSTTVALVLYF